MPPASPAASTPRITPIPDGSPGPHEASFARSRELWGAAPNFFRTLAHNPGALERIMGLSGALRGRWRGEPARMRLMQLAIVTPSMMNRRLI